MPYELANIAKCTKKEDYNKPKAVFSIEKGLIFVFLWQRYMVCFLSLWATNIKKRLQKCAFGTLVRSGRNNR
jgi:hypothetical protein